eukprot:g855.t1
MSGILESLPGPKRVYKVYKDDVPRKRSAKGESAVVIPRYGDRGGFVPRKEEDFGDGGAFPEIHVAQYPLGMGKKSGNVGDDVVPVTVDAETGIVEYDAVVKRGGAAYVQSKFTDLIERNNSVGDEELQRPSEEEATKTAEETRRALMKVVDTKVAMARTVKYGENPNAIEARTKYIRYTPREDAPGYNPNVKQRVIKMVEAQVDPMQPPKFRHKKIPRAAPDAPVPVLHSPPRKLTAEDHKNWKIPPCISNWKNSRGYTVSLDKRMAADGRNLQEHTVNSNFAKLAESLYIAERKARVEVETRAALARRSRQAEKESKEEELRKIAEQARMVHKQVTSQGSASSSRRRPSSEHESSDDDSSSSGSDSSDDDSDSANDEEREARIRRDRLRAERKRERERDMRLEAKGKRSKTMRDHERDVSERVALGLPTGKSGKSQGTKYDTRLFNQAGEGGMNSGFGKDDEYNLYSKPLFDKGAAEQIYRPTRSSADKYGNVEEHYSRIKNYGDKFRPDKDFKGVADARKSGITRSGPVQFERGAPGAEDEQDPFGLDSFLSEAKKGKKRGILENRSGRGTMSASGGSALRSAKDDDESWRTRKMEFTRGSGK